MATRQALDDGLADARLAFGTAAACVAAYAAFVVLPVYATHAWLPVGLDALWVVGGQLTVFLAPVAAGLSGYASVVALWSKGDALDAASRRLHLMTLLVVASLCLVLVSSWGSDVVAWWLD